MVSVGVSKRSMSKMLTLGVVLVSEGDKMGGWERIICQVSDTDGTHGSVVFGVGRGVGGEELSLSSSLPPPKVRPRPNPRPSARIRVAMRIRRRSLRRKDHGWRGLRFASIACLCCWLLEE